MGDLLTKIFSNFFQEKQVKIQSSEQLINEMKEQGYDLEKIATILDFVNSFIPSNLMVLAFIALSFIIFMILSTRIINKGAHRYSSIVFITYAFGSISSGLSTIVLFITSFLIISLIYTTLVLKTLYLEINSLISIFTLLYVIICFSVIIIEKSLLFGVSKKIS